MFQHLPKSFKTKMDIPKRIETLKTIDQIKKEIGLREYYINEFKKVLPTLNMMDERSAVELENKICEYSNDIVDLKRMLEEKLTNSTRKKYNFPIIDVPASGNANYWEGAFTLCFVYSKYKGNFILRGWREEVMEYLKKNYTHYFYYVSMWHNGSSRGSWGFWKDSVTIFQPSKIFKSWKYKIVKYDGSGMYERERVKELEFKRLPKRWINEFDEL